MYACARAEKLASSAVRPLVWFSPDCLIVNPPSLYELDLAHDVALRPVHIKNIGLDVTEPLNGFWKATYDDVGVRDIDYAVESFVDCQRL